MELTKLGKTIFVDIAIIFSPVDRMDWADRVKGLASRDWDGVAALVRLSWGKRNLTNQNISSQISSIVNFFEGRLRVKGRID